MRWFAVLVVLVVTVFAGGVAGAPGMQKVTIVMSEMSFTPSKISLQAGARAGIALTNEGMVKHDFWVHEPPMKPLSAKERKKWAEANSYFKGLEVKVEGGGIEVEGRDIFVIEIGRGKSAEVRFTPTKKGTFEIACLVEGHYEGGMKGTLTVK